MSPSAQITALASGFGENPPDTVAPCKKNKVHKLDVTVTWEDDGSPVRMTDIKIYRGKTLYADDSVVKGKCAEKGVPPGTYHSFFPDIDASEIQQG